MRVGMINTVLSVPPGPADSSGFPGTSHTPSSHQQSFTLLLLQLNFLWPHMHWSCLLYEQHEYIKTASNEERFTMFCLRFVLSISCCLVNTVLRSSGWYVSPWVLCLWPPVCKSMLNCKHRRLLSVRLDSFSSCFQSPCAYFWIAQQWIWTEM